MSILKEIVQWLGEVTSDDHIISRAAGVPTLKEKAAARDPARRRSEMSEITRTTDALGQLMETLNRNETRTQLQVSVWYSHNDGTWKWAYIDPKAVQ
jgi:hypothetical protein